MTWLFNIKNIKRYLLLTLFTLGFVFSSLTVYAQENMSPNGGGGQNNAPVNVTPVAANPVTPGTPNRTYQPLVGIPGVDNAASNFGTYLNQLYFLAISIAALISVIKIIIAGVKYMLADVVTSKADAKKDIWGSLLGLLLIVSAVLILGTINPNLTNLNVLSGAPALQTSTQGSAPVTNGTLVGSGSGVAVPNAAGGVSTSPTQQPGMSFDQLSVQAQQGAENACNARTGFARSYVYRIIDADASERTGRIIYTTRTSEPTGNMPNRDLVRIDCNPPTTP